MSVTFSIHQMVFVQVLTTTFGETQDNSGDYDTGQVVNECSGDRDDAEGNDQNASHMLPTRLKTSFEGTSTRM